MASLDERSVLTDPFEQFNKWFQEAQSSQLLEPNAMVISTQSLDQGVSSRTVLLKGLDDEGFVFYTNYDSQKGQELAANPSCSILFPWLQLERQVIVKGTAKKISREESAVYFLIRPRQSQIGAHVSNQSSVIPNREFLESRQAELEAEYEGKEIPLPDYWGGYRIIPTCFEFWQGRSSRLHDRLVFTKQDDNWNLSRLSP